MNDTIYFKVEVNTSHISPTTHEDPHTKSRHTMHAKVSHLVSTSNVETIDSDRFFGNPFVTHFIN